MTPLASRRAVGSCLGNPMSLAELLNKSDLIHCFSFVDLENNQKFNGTNVWSRVPALLWGLTHIQVPMAWHTVIKGDVSLKFKRFLLTPATRWKRSWQNSNFPFYFPPYLRKPPKISQIKAHVQSLLALCHWLYISVCICQSKLLSLARTPQRRKEQWERTDRKIRALFTSWAASIGSGNYTKERFVPSLLETTILWRVDVTPSNELRCPETKLTKDLWWKPLLEVFVFQKRWNMFEKNKQRMKGVSCCQLV